MKNNNIIDQIEKQHEEERNAVKEIVAEMMMAYRPVRGDEEPTCEMTSQELADTFQENIHVTASELSLLLHKNGYHIKLKGGRFLWQLVLR